MKSVFRGVGLAVALVVLGCGDGGAGAKASAEPGKSGAASAAPKGSAAPGAKPGDKPESKPGDKPADKPAAGGVDVLKHMPKDCDEGRIFVAASKLISAESADILNGLTTQGLAQSKDAKKSEEVVKILKDGGIEPMKQLTDVAMCMGKEKKTVMVAAVDFSKADKPADTIAKALEAGDGKPWKREDAGDVVYLSNPDGKSVMAVVGKAAVVIGDTKELVEAAVKGPDGGAAFGDARSHVVWAKMVEDDTTVTLKEAGENHDLKISMKDKNAAKMKEDMEKMAPMADEFAKKEPMVAPLLPIAKNAKATVEGEVLTLTTSFPKNTLADFLKGLKDKKLADIMKSMPIP
jgi:hypothetical protein